MNSDSQQVMIQLPGEDKGNGKLKSLNAPQSAYAQEFIQWPKLSVSKCQMHGVWRQNGTEWTLQVRTIKEWCGDFDYNCKEL